MSKHCANLLAFIFLININISNQKKKLNPNIHLDEAFAINLNMTVCAYLIYLQDFA